MIEVMPFIITALTAMVKFLNHHFNRDLFKVLFDRIAFQWETYELYGEMHILNEIIEGGSKLGTFYRRSIFSAMVIFLAVPLGPPLLDIVTPLNKSRDGIPLFKLNYVYNTEDYFYVVYLQSGWSTIVVISIIAVMDSFYIVVAHYVSGLFSICGYQIKKTLAVNDTRINKLAMKNVDPSQFKRCVITHFEALECYECLVQVTHDYYLIQFILLTLNFVGSAVQVIMYFNRPEELVRLTLYLVGQQFHLYMLSINGQLILDKTIELADAIYEATWYQVPMKYQRMLHTMQIRCSRPCKLTAGGLCDINIETFGATIKTCISYVTFVLSLRE